MINVRILGMVVAAFIAGTFAASPELRAFAANTVGSLDIINESIQSVDIKNGEVKAFDIGGNAVTSAKIAGGAVGNTDIAGNAVTTGKIADGQVQTGDIQNGAVARVKLGSDVIDTLTVITRGGTLTPIGAGGQVVLTALCQSGEIVTGGGYVANNVGLIVFQNAAKFGNSGWEITVRNTSNSEVSIVPTAQCAKLSP
jgi:hypothetical protein